MDIWFHGAAGSVTGSRFLVRAGRTRILVDCGLFQGLKTLRLRNREPLPFDPRRLDAVVLTHAHLDHSGFLPALVKQGFDGPILCSAATADLAGLLLPDSGHIQEEDASYAARKGFSRHRRPEPLYTEADAVRCLAQLRPIDLDTDHEVGDLVVRLRRAGHILGAATVELTGDDTRVLFSGDLGRPDDLLIPAPAPVERPPRFVVMESTYGDRHHPDVDPLEQLGEVVGRTLERRGTVLIPSFAVGRAQAILLALHRLVERGTLPRDLPIYLNSPLAIETTELYLRHMDAHRLDPAEVQRLYERVTLVRTADESRALCQRHEPSVIVSASGLLTGGRVLHPLARVAPRPEDTILLVGFQAAGTRGAALRDGATEVKVHGEMIPVRCEVATADAWSAHADATELVHWLRAFPEPPEQVFLVHGEPSASDALRRRITDELGWDVSIPDLHDMVPLSRPRRPVPATFYPAGPEPDFLDNPELAGARLMLDYAEAAVALRDAGITDTVLVIGSSRADPHDRWYEEARSFARLASSEPVDGGMRLVVVTGGGPGIMEAANRGARDAGQPTVAFTLATDRHEPNAYTSPLCFRFRYEATRQLHLALRTRAVVAFPGGFGTLDDLFDFLALVQSGQASRMPFVLVGRQFWHEVLDGDILVQKGLVSEDDLRDIRYADDAVQAWELLRSWVEEEAQPR